VHWHSGCCILLNYLQQTAVHIPFGYVKWQKSQLYWPRDDISWNLVVKKNEHSSRLNIRVMPDGQNTFGNRYGNFDFSLRIIEHDCVARGGDVETGECSLTTIQCSPEIICSRWSSDTIEQQIIFPPKMPSTLLNS